MNTVQLIQKAFEYEFLQKALLCGVLIAVTSSLLGVFLVLRKQSLISDGLSHVSFASVAVALFLGWSPVIVSIPIVIFASILINKLSEKASLYNDAAIGLVSAMSIAIGVSIVSLSKGFNVDIYSYLFGSILAISSLEVVLSLVIAIAVVTTIILFFNELFLLTFDQDYAHISKIKIDLIQLVFSVIQSVTIVIGVKIVGAMLISSLIIFPAISALQIAKNFRTMITFSLILSVTSVVLGILFSFLLNTPTGATIVIINGLFFIALFTINKI